MILVDVNLLLYAINRSAPQHAAARRWLEQALDGDEPVGFAWIVVLSFLRLSTNRHVFPEPLSAEIAIGIAESWLTRPNVRVVDPGRRHWDIFKRLLEGAGAAGNLTADAHLASIAIEHGWELHSSDHDFGRFPGLRWRNPLVE